MTAIEQQTLAIINGDVVAYSRLMAADEVRAIRSVTELRDIVGLIVVANHGRLVDFTGDNFLAEFGLAHHAYHCALEIQEAAQRRNCEAAPADRMEFRIGLHVGDVHIDGDRLFGTTVNVASRLETLAPAGGICLSAAMVAQIRAPSAVTIDDLGERTLRNIPEPVHAFTIGPEAVMSAQKTASGEGARAAPAIPTIAVLPFTELSGETELGSLAEVITVDVITTLSCDRRLSVIAYNSVARLRNRQSEFRDIGRMLGARYLVEGSLRRLGPRLRITVALVDVETRRELWGGHVDREHDDIYDAFDEVVESLATALASHLRMVEGRRYKRRAPTRLDAWSLAVQAAEVFFLNPTKSLDDSLDLARRALETDPGYPYAWAVLGFLTAFKFPLGLSTDHQADIDESLRLTDRALAMDAQDPWNLVARAIALQYAGRPAESMQYLQRSLRMNPSDVLTHCYYGRGLMFSGKPGIALAHFERFHRLNPNDPGAHMASMYHAIALAFLGRFVESEDVARESLAAAGGRNPWSLVFLSISLGGQGRLDEAAALLPELSRIAPHWDQAFIRGFLDDCEEDKSLLPPLFDILEAVWARADSNAASQGT